MSNKKSKSLMNKYIPADKLIAEIERQQRQLMILFNTEQADIRRDCALQNGVYNHILNLIYSLQQEEPCTSEIIEEKDID